MTPEQQNFVARVQDVARLLKAQYGELAMLNALWYGAEADYDALITDEALAGVPSLAHLEAAHLNEILYVVGQLKGLLDARLEQVAVVAQ